MSQPNTAIAGGPSQVASAGARAFRIAGMSVAELLQFGFIVLQLAVIVWLCRALDIENTAFNEIILPASVAGFVVNHFLPMPWRMPFFAVLSLGLVVATFGVAQGAWLVGLGLLLISLCRLPIGWWYRVGLVVGVGGTLAAMRAGALSAPWEVSVWPILGSMFMFRLIAYLYEAKHAPKPAGWTESVAYFFCLPNVAFPLFPVIDFATFRRTHYDKPALGIYEQGVSWIARGLVHLVLYRLVYNRLTISPEEVQTFGDLLRYLLANFGLYLRVSGQFHLIVGMLHLFGFRLPETHRFFYLASSFTDFWRRINIYWKDFMQKLVYRPAYYAVKGRGETTALVTGTLSVFVATWFFHSYQWFWLLGTWLFSLTDTLFWGILAVVLVVNALWEARAGRVRSLGRAQWSWGNALRTAGTTILTFAAICFLWGLWTAPTLPDFIATISVAPPTVRDLGALMLVLGVVGGASLVSYRRLVSSAATGEAWMRGGTLACIGFLTFVAVAAGPFGRRKLPLPVNVLSREVSVAELNERDAARLQRGYYEQIVGVQAFNGQLWELYSKRDNKARLREAQVMAGTNDALLMSLRPNVREVFKGKAFSTNRWGMRDQDYAQAPPARTIRVAVLGQSYVMGSGVGDGETFEAVVEDRLNRELTPTTGFRYELLNFGASGYSLQQQVALLESGRVFGFEPNHVLLIGHDVDVTRTLQYMQQVLARGTTPSDSTLRALLDANGLDRWTPEVEFMRKLRPHAPALLSRLLQQFADLSLGKGITPIWMYVPTPLSELNARYRHVMTEAAQKAGFKVIDIGDPYEGKDESTLVVAEDDHHPNTEGHRLIAERMFQTLVTLPQLVPDSVSLRQRP